jgi:hypothetical protein
MADFGLTGRNWGDSAVTALKVMRDNGSHVVLYSEMLSLDSVVLERNQPSSFKLQVLNQIASPVGFPLTVEVLGDSTSKSVIHFVPSSGTAINQSPALGKDTVHLDGLTGTYTISVTRPGYTYEPLQVVWQAGQSSKVIFQQYVGGAVFSPDPPQTIVLNEMNVKVLPLNSLATDPVNQTPLNWAIDSVTGDKIPWKLDATLGQLTLGDPSSFQYGSATIYLRATTQSGAPKRDSLKVQILHVNQPPQILAKTWSVASGAVLDINLDSTSNSLGVWARDPDDGMLNLTWTVNLDANSPQGANVTIQNRRLKFQAPTGFQGDVVLHVTVTDPAGLATAADVRVCIAPPEVSLFGFQPVQSTAGDLEVHFFSRYSLEPVSLQNGIVKLQNPSSAVWGTVPASLEVIASPGFNNGLWTDGEYRIRILRSASWTTGSTVRSLTQLLAGRTTLNAQLPLAADGKILVQPQTFTPVDFSGPTATLSVQVIPATSDPLLRQPNLLVAWNWVGTPGIPDRLVVTRTDGSGADPVVVQLDPTAASSTITGLQDSRTYLVSLLAHDQNSNPGGGAQTITTPSGNYQIALQMNDPELAQVTGSLCATDDHLVQVCQDLSAGVAGIHTFTGLHNGIYSFQVNDTRWVGAGGTLTAKIDHQDVTQAWNLVPKSFLVSGSESVEQDIGTGDLVVRVEVSNAFDHEQANSLTLSWLTTGTATAGQHQVVLPVPNGGFSSDGSTWTLRWKISDLPTAVLAATALGNLDRKSLTGIAITTGLANSSVGPILRTDALTEGTAGSPFAWRVWSFAPPTLDTSESKTINDSGITTWRMSFGAIHGAIPAFHICRHETVGDPTCVDTIVGVEADILRFQPTALAAYGVPGRRTFEELPGGGAVRVPAGADSAAAQWKVWSNSAGTFDVWVNWSTPKLSGEMGISTDSGVTWPVRGNYFFEGWNDLGAISLRAGWNSLSVFGSKGVSFQGVALVGSGVTFDKPSPATLPVLDGAAKGILSVPLTLGRAYQTQVTSTDAYGFKVVESDDFNINPDGFFGDVLLTQEDGTGDLLLLAGETRITTAPGALQVRLAPGIPAITPSSIDSVTGNGQLQIRLARKDLPTEFLNSVFAKAPALDSIRLITSLPVTYTWTQRKCHNWGFSCKSVVNSRTTNVTDSVSADTSK